MKIYEDDGAARLLRWDRYSKGKTFYETEYGIEYPNGTIKWIAARDDDQITTPEGRELINKSFHKSIERAQVTRQPDLIFWVRRKTTKFNEPERLA